MSKLFNETMLDFAKENYPTKNITQIARELKAKYPNYFTDKPVEKIRRALSHVLNGRVKKEEVKKENSTLEKTTEFLEASKRKLTTSDFYLVTWQQNNTKVNKKVWDTILSIKKFFKAELSVILGRYVHNSESKYNFVGDTAWEGFTSDYWDTNRHSVKGVMVMGDVNIIPTAKYPIRGLQGLAKGESMVFGHPKLHLQVEPTVEFSSHQVLVSTGAITYPNYSYSKIGKEAEGRHKYGCVLLEKVGSQIYVHQIEVTPKGEAYFLKWKFTPDGHKEHKEVIPAIIFGDTHVGEHDLEIEKENYNICKKLNPKNIVFHDLFNGNTVNSYINKTPLSKAVMLKNKQYTILEEINDTLTYLKKYESWNPIVVQSNHNDRLDRALNNDWRQDLLNADFYFKYSKLVLDGELDSDLGVLGYEINKNFKNAVALKIGDSFKVKNIELSLHGDYGVSGSRGTPTSFHRLNQKNVFGHLHTSIRMDDTLFVGTNTIVPLPYAKKGISKTHQSNVIINPNGTMAHLLFFNGKFTNLL